MAIRITGMYSGLDTESIINELASAQSYKKNKLVKAQMKLSWKQDAWKALNTKLYSFYTKLDDLRMQASYMKKKTTVSNPNAIQVTGSQVDGTHSVKVTSLSKRAAVTSGKLNAGKNYNYTGNATLKQLGFTGTGTVHISDNYGGSVDIDVDENMKINDFVKAITDNTALSASYDQDNQRIYIGSWTSGEDGNFYLSGNDKGGMEALKALKLISEEDIDKMTGAGGEYAVWSEYRTGGSVTGTPTQDYLDLIKEETLARLKALKEQNDKLEQANKDYDEANQKNVDMLKEIQSNVDGKYDDFTGFIDSTYDFDTMTPEDIMDAGEKLYDEIYGAKTTQPVQAKDEDGNLLYESDGVTPVYVQAKDEEGNLLYESDGVTPVYETETVRTGGMKGQLESLQEDLKTKKEALEQARKDLEADPTNTGLQDAVKAAEQAVADASEAVSDQQTKINKAEQVYSFYNAYKQNYDKKLANQETIKENNDRFTYSKVGDVETYMEKDASGQEVAVGQGVTAAEVTAELDKKVDIAQQVMKDADTWKSEAQATKVVGKDSEIEVDGVTYNSYNDTVTVNGMTITAMETTEKEVTVATKDDTEGIYDMIKDFIKAYSELINEMDALYNADSAKDYEPLLSEEKEALSDSEVEEWEKKIKDSLLRRDTTLSDIGSAMKMTMMQGIKIGGVNFYLSDFGINTLGYFNSKENERNAYHIDGDADDDKTKNNTDVLLEAITKNPNAVMEFFTGLTNNLHDTLAAKMSATTMSSALTFYNDKKMKEEYDDYTDKIKKQEEKLNAYIDKWYTKFSAMETALAKLESKNSSLTSLFGG